MLLQQIFKRRIVIIMSSAKILSRQRAKKNSPKKFCGESGALMTIQPMGISNQACFPL
jgi:hypothetical protein